MHHPAKLIVHLWTNSVNCSWLSRYSSRTDARPNQHSFK